MDYKAADFRISPMSQEAADVLAAMLGEVGFDTFETTEQGLMAYIAANRFSEPEVKQVIGNFFLPGHTITYNVSDIKGRDWNEEWEHESFDPVLEREFGIRLRPRGAFGSGSHETTRQLVELLCGIDFSGQRVLDMGCGTGVLAIAMAKSGAADVVAIDIDDLSVANTFENFELNGLNGAEILHGDATAIHGEFNTIVANIHKNVILADLPVYAAHLADGGLLVTSGFYTEDSADIISAAQALRLTLSGQRDLNRWTVLSFIKSQ